MKLCSQEDHLHGFVDMLVYFSNCIQKLRLQNLWKKLFYNDVFSIVKSAVSCFHHLHYYDIQIHRSSAAWLVSLAFGSWISSKIINTTIIIIHFNIITIMIITTLWSAASLVAGTSPQYLLLCSLESYHFYALYSGLDLFWIALRFAKIHGHVLSCQMFLKCKCGFIHHVFNSDIFKLLIWDARILSPWWMYF